MPTSGVTQRCPDRYLRYAWKFSSRRRSNRRCSFHAVVLTGPARHGLHPFTIRLPTAGQDHGRMRPLAFTARAAFESTLIGATIEQSNDQ
jgi:hypothetical protein